MPLTPVEIRHIELKRAWLRGYRRKPVDNLLEEIADSFEEVWRERADLSDRLEELEAEAAKHRELEALLRSTLVSAERAAQDMKEQARRESDLIVQEAHAESRRVAREAAAEKRQARGGHRQDPRPAPRGLRVARRRGRRDEAAAGETGGRDRRHASDAGRGDQGGRDPQGRGLGLDILGRADPAHDSATPRRPRARRPAGRRPGRRRLEGAGQCGAEAAGRTTPSWRSWRIRSTCSPRSRADVSGFRRATRSSRSTG